MSRFARTIIVATNPSNTHPIGDASHDAWRCNVRALEIATATVPAMPSRTRMSPHQPANRALIHGGLRWILSRSAPDPMIAITDATT
jgi:hypothetical protein